MYVYACMYIYIYIKLARGRPMWSRPTCNAVLSQTRQHLTNINCWSRWAFTSDSAVLGIPANYVKTPIKLILLKALCGGSRSLGSSGMWCLSTYVMI